MMNTHEHKRWLWIRSVSVVITILVLFLTIKASDIHKTEKLFPVIHSPANTGGNQGFAIYDQVIFQLYNDNTVVLIDYLTGNMICQLPIQSDHGDNIDFSNEFYSENDEFPLAYITADTNPAKVYVVQITRTTTNLIRTFCFENLDETGYYAGHCLDAATNVLYMVGYASNCYYKNENGNNYMIVSVWNLEKSFENEDGTLKPELIDTFSVPFIITVQGQRYFEGNLYLLSSHNGVDNIDINTKIYVISPVKRKIISIDKSFPREIRLKECEGLEFLENQNSFDLVISNYGEKNNYYAIRSYLKK